LQCIAQVNLYQGEVAKSFMSGEANLLNMITNPMKDTVLLTDSDSDPEDNEITSESEVEISLSGSESETDQGTKKLNLMLSNMINDLGEDFLSFYSINE